VLDRWLLVRLYIAGWLCCYDCRGNLLRQSCVVVLLHSRVMQQRLKASSASCPDAAFGVSGC
jgi:hypothetical protein